MIFLFFKTSYLEPELERVEDMSTFAGMMLLFFLVSRLRSVMMGMVMSKLVGMVMSKGWRW